MNTEILLDLERVLQAGTAEEIAQFVRGRWMEFPQRLKDRLVVAILVDAIQRHDEENREVNEFQTALIGLLEEIDGAK